VRGGRGTCAATCLHACAGTQAQAEVGTAMGVQLYSAGNGGGAVGIRGQEMRCAPRPAKPADKAESPADSHADSIAQSQRGQRSITGQAPRPSLPCALICKRTSPPSAAQLIKPSHTGVSIRVTSQPLESGVVRHSGDVPTHWIHGRERGQWGYQNGLNHVAMRRRTAEQSTPRRGPGRCASRCCRCHHCRQSVQLQPLRLGGGGCASLASHTGRGPAQAS